MTKVDIENRLMAIEADLAALKAAVPNRSPLHPVHVIERMHGKFEDDDAFREAVRLGRQWRQSDRPKRSRVKARRK